MASRNDETPQRSATTPRQDPYWPQVADGHPITELMAPTQGSPSPFGDTEFPLPADELEYEHPVTEINR